MSGRKEDMMGNPKPLTGDSSIADWLADPA